MLYWLPYLRKIIHTYVKYSGIKGESGEIKFLDDFKDFWRIQSKNYKIFLVRDILSSLLGMIGDQYGTIYMYALGATAFDIGLLNSINAAVRMLLALPGGLLIDRSKKIKKTIYNRSISSVICKSN